MRLNSDVGPALAAFAAGLTMWFVVVASALEAEAFDTRGYFTVGLPLLAAACLVIGFAAPRRAWRWGVCALGAQAAALVATASVAREGAALLPLGLAFFSVLAIPTALAAELGALARRRVAAHGAAPEEDLGR